MALRILSSENISGVLTINTNDASGNRIGFKGDGATTGTAIHTNWTTGNAYLDFRLGGDTDTYTKMRITSAGYVGIGTTSPNKELTLGGAAGTQTLSFTTSAYLGDQAVIGNIEFSTHNADTSYGQLANIYALKTGTNTNSGSLTFWTKQNGGRDERMRIAESGNVGIGTDSPDNKLEVQGVISSADAGLQKATFSNVGNDLVLTANADATNVTANMLFKSSGSGGAAVSEKMRIRGSGTVGIGSDGFDSQMLTIAAGTLDGAIYATSTDANCFASFRDNSSTANIEYGAIGNNHVFRKDATEQMRIDSSGNVGIGTDSPSRKLVVAQSNVTEPSGIDANTGILIKNNTWSGISMISTEATGNFITFGDNASGFAGRIQYSHATNAMQFETAAAERMRINSSGNVGIGTTAPSSKLQVKGNICVNSESVSTANEEIDKIEFKKSHPNGVSGYYTLGEIRSKTFGGYSGGLNFYTGRATTPGSYASTFAMTIDNKGQVGIGVELLPTDVYKATGGGYAVLGMGQSSFLTAYKADDSIELCQNTYLNTGGANNGVIASVPAARLTLVDGQFVFATLQTAANYSQTAVNAMKITDGAEFFVGDTGTNYGYSAHHIAKDSSQGYALIVRNSNTTTTNNSVIQLNQATTGTNGYFMICRQGDPNSGTNRLFIFSNGNIQNVNNSYGAISDERLKENIVDATPKLDDLMKVKVRNFNLKGEETKQIGVVAQELEEVFPGMIDESKDPDSEDETLYKGVKYSVFVPILIKAIQELKAEIEILKNK